MSSHLSNIARSLKRGKAGCRHPHYGGRGSRLGVKSQPRPKPAKKVKVKVKRRPISVAQTYRAPTRAERQPAHAAKMARKRARR